MFAGKLPALSVTFDLTSSKTDKTARQWHVIVPGKTQGYLILCNASSPGWAKALPVFKRMLNSLKIDLEEAQVSGGVTRKSRRAAWPPWESPRCRRGSSRTASPR